jgi:hypothetical protein
MTGEALRRRRDHAIAALALGPVERKVGTLQESVRRCVLSSSRRNADRYGDGDGARPAMDCERRGSNPLPDALGYGVRAFERRIGHEHHDLLPAEAGHDINPARKRPDPASEVAQHLVACVMAIVLLRHKGWCSDACLGE